MTATNPALSGWDAQLGRHESVVRRSASCLGVDGGTIARNTFDIAGVPDPRRPTAGSKALAPRREWPAIVRFLLAHNLKIAGFREPWVNVRSLERVYCKVRKRRAVLHQHRRARCKGVER